MLKVLVRLPSAVQVVTPLVLLLAGCPQPTAQCDATVVVFTDADGDGYGTGSPIDVCAIGAGQADRALDCDDADPAVSPDAEEVCDDVDNNCDGQVDEALKDRKQYWADHDGDGFGGRYESMLACAPPGDGWSKNSDDCDDVDPARNPDAPEVCGGGDEDCDGLADDLDPDVDVTTFTTFYGDADHDGKGDPAKPLHACALEAGMSTNALDCDDANALIGQLKFYTDADHDGYGDPATVQLACNAPAGTVANNLDCDDTDDQINLPRSWYDDADGDGYGGPVVAAFACEAPLGAVALGTDCDDADPDVSPAALEVCDNGADENCDGSDRCDTCQRLLTVTPGAADGEYSLDMPAGPVGAYCDMTTDGGGWTLVLSSQGPPSDQADATHYADLTTMSPTAFHAGIWDGMRPILPATSDIRFACRTAGVITVDLSFYDSAWYQELTASTKEKDVCFEQGAGTGYSYPVERRNNINGATRPAGDDWNVGYLSGEDACNASDDFVVDFDDGGMDGNPNDGTDWGKGNGSNRCGTVGATGTWYIFVRE